MTKMKSRSPPDHVSFRLERCAVGEPQPDTGRPWSKLGQVTGWCRGVFAVATTTRLASYTWKTHMFAWGA